MTVRVFIATTKGPVEVQRITREELPENGPTVDSCMTLGDTPRELPVSRDYNRFVRRGTGVIDKLTGHTSFRVALSDRIDSGNSWQLGTLLAHLFERDNNLASLDEQADVVVWATGAISTHDLSVGAVESVATKLEKSLPLFQQCLAKQTPVFAFYPKACQSEVPGDWLNQHQLPEQAVLLLPIEQFDELTEALPAEAAEINRAVGNLNPLVPTQTPVKPAPTSRFQPLAIGLLIALIAISWWLYQSGSLAPDLPKIQAELAIEENAVEEETPTTEVGGLEPAIPFSEIAFDLTLEAEISALGTRCQSSQTQSYVALNGRFAELDLGTLCSLGYVLEGDKIPHGTDIQLYAVALDAAVSIPVRKLGSHHWNMALPENASRDRTYAVILSDSLLDFSKENLPSLLTLETLDRWLNDRHIGYQLYEHSLAADW